MPLCLLDIYALPPTSQLFWCLATMMFLLLRLMACELCLRCTMRWYFQSLSCVCHIECDGEDYTGLREHFKRFIFFVDHVPPLLHLGNVCASAVHLVMLKLNLSCTSVSRIYCCLHVFSWNSRESSHELSFYVRHVCSFRPCCLEVNQQLRSSGVRSSLCGSLSLPWNNKTVHFEVVMKSEYKFRSLVH